MTPFSDRGVHHVIQEGFELLRRLASTSGVRPVEDLFMDAARFDACGAAFTFDAIVAPIPLMPSRGRLLNKSSKHISTPSTPLTASCTKLNCRRGISRIHVVVLVLQILGQGFGQVRVGLNMLHSHVTGPEPLPVFWAQIAPKMASALPFFSKACQAALKGRLICTV